MRGAAAIAKSAVGIGTAVAMLSWAAGSPAEDIRMVSGASGFERALPAAAGLVAWACASWFAAVVAAVALAAAPGAIGRWAAGLSRRLAPRFMRTAARWVVGVALVAGPLASTPALAASPSPAAGPNLDRPAAASVVLEPAASAPTSPSGYPTTAALDLDRPLAPYLPPPPVPPKPAPSTGNATLLTGNAHREQADDNYVVRRGDTLWAVAARHLGPSATAVDIAREWPRWYAANRKVIGTDPQLILPGTVLHAPAG